MEGGGAFDIQRISTMSVFPTVLSLKNIKFEIQETILLLFSLGVKTLKNVFTFFSSPISHPFYSAKTSILHKKTLKTLK